MMRWLLGTLRPPGQCVGAAEASSPVFTLFVLLPAWCLFCAHL